MNQISQSSNEHLIEKYKYLFCFAGIGIVYFFNLFIDVMEIDAAQYAAISREMIENGSYLRVYQHGQDYLDKPPLLFWLSSLSMFIFGISNWAYKLPAVLIILLGVFSMYSFTRLWYSKQTAIFATLIFGTTQALFLITNDIRTDGILTGFVMLALWQLCLFLRNNRLINLLVGALAVGAAMLSKGPIAIIIVAFCLGGDWLIKRQFKNFFKLQWLMALVVIALLLAPMCYGLYQQFDLHPEKEVYGLKGPSGLRFYFWTQSFGRITGESSWKSHRNFFYFFHTILWDFQPWILFLVPALFSRIKDLFQTRFNGSPDKEYMTICGFLLSFIALSLSSYKLPHYIYPLFPFIAIMTADYIVSAAEQDGKFIRFLSKLQFVILHAFFIIPFLAFYFVFPLQSYWLPFAIVLMFFMYWYSIKLFQKADRIILPTVIAAVAFGLTMSTYFYPNLLHYQSKSVVAKEMAAKKIPIYQLYTYHTEGFSLDFYLNRIVPSFVIAKINSYTAGTYVFTNKEGMDEIINNSTNYTLVKTYDEYPVTKLKLTFLYSKTRPERLTKTYLLVKEN